MKKIQSALISVFYKDGLEPIVKCLHQNGITIYSTGGTKEFIEKCALVCQNMEDQDGAQEKWEQLLEFFFEKTLELAEDGGGGTLEIPDFIPEEGF